MTEEELNQLEGVSKPLPSAPAPPVGSDPYVSGTLPGFLGIATDVAKTQPNGPLPVYRLFPIPAGSAGNAQANSGAQSNLGKSPTFQAVQTQTATNTTQIAAQALTGWQGAFQVAVNYSLGAIVESGSTVYVSLANQNLGNTPASSPTFWQATGQVSFAGAWSNSVTYNQGQIVDSGGTLYISVINSNTGNNPSTSPSDWQQVGGTNSSVFLGAYNSGTTYALGNQVTYGTPSGYYISLVNSNTGNTPSSSPSDWQLISSANTDIYEGSYSGATAYVPGNSVSYSDGNYYVCISNTTGNAPSATGSSFWTLLGTSNALIGAWSNSVAYSQGMQVTFSGNFYTALAANTNISPSTNASNATWQLVGPNSLDNLVDGTVTGRTATPVNVQVFTSGTTNWTKPALAGSVFIYLTGGGGGGGVGSTVTAGAGGGGGGISFQVVPASVLGSTVSVTAGAGGTSSSSGGSTSFGSILQATGGAGGIAATPGTGGTGNFGNGGTGGTPGVSPTAPTQGTGLAAGGGGYGGTGSATGGTGANGAPARGAVPTGGSGGAGSTSGAGTTGSVGGSVNSDESAGGAGAGGGGGSTHTGSNGGQGGVGGTYGGGGGGGGECNTGNALGGAGGGGLAVIITHFS